jgi:hypothetical protein
MVKVRQSAEFGIFGLIQSRHNVSTVATLVIDVVLNV